LQRLFLFFEEVTMGRRGPPVQDEGVWISGRSACRLAAINPYRLQRSALMGLIRTQALPGEPLRYNRVDVIRLARSRRQPAGAAPPPAKGGPR
jgi:hypothetical protein